jgi:hypothetical protein
VDPTAKSNYAIRWAAKYGRAECLKLLLADPRVDPSAVVRRACASNVQGLIKHIQACKDGDLDSFKQVNPASVSSDVLDILVSRNRSFPHVLRHLVGIQLDRLAVPETVRADPAFETLISLVISRGPWRTSDLSTIIRTFFRLRHVGVPSDVAASIASYSGGSVA